MNIFKTTAASYAQRVAAEIAVHGYGNFYDSDRYRLGQIPYTLPPTSTQPSTPVSSPDVIASRAPSPASPIAGFPAARPSPYPIEDTEPIAVPPASPFLNATSRALGRDAEHFHLQESDFSPRARQFLELSADRRSHRSSSPMTAPDNASDGGDCEESVSMSSQIGTDSDLGDGSDEDSAIGASAVLPPASTATGPVEIDATIPHSFFTSEGGPYVVQIDLPRDHISSGVDIRTRVRVNVSLSTIHSLSNFLTIIKNISQVTVTACGPSTNGAFAVGSDHEQLQREDERYFRWRNGQRMNDFVRWHLNSTLR